MVEEVVARSDGVGGEGVGGDDNRLCLPPPSLHHLLLSVLHDSVKAMGFLTVGQVDTRSAPVPGAQMWCG
jgi:hypothetical protein